MASTSSATSSRPLVQNQTSTLRSSFLSSPSSLSLPATLVNGEEETTNNNESQRDEIKHNKDQTRPVIYPILSEGHPIVEGSEFGTEQYDNEKSDVCKSASITPRRGRTKATAAPATVVTFSSTPDHFSDPDRTIRGIGSEHYYKPEIPSTPSFSSLHSSVYGTSPSDTGSSEPRPHPKLVKAGPYLTIAALQAYTILTVVRCLADPTWIVLMSNDDKSGGRENTISLGLIGRVERWCLACAIAFTILSCLGVTLRIMDKMAWLRKVPVICAYFQAIFCIAAMSSFLCTQHLPPGAQFSHGFLACVITVILSSIVAIMLTIDWWRGFPSAGLSAALKALIVSSFMMTIVIIVGAAIYTWLEGWTFDQAVNFWISAIAFFIVSLRNAVIEQFQWRLIERFSMPSHLTRVQTMMSARDLSYPIARFEEEKRVKRVVKRKMIMRMGCIWIVLWFGGAGVFCALEKWSFLESLYFCYVTLTTIGFGDYVPREPGSIEFWNIYVFIGLAIFAYILSLFSESMAAHIHLVDDEDINDDEDMYGWEQCEDPLNNLNNGPPLLFRPSVLGIDAASSPLLNLDSRATISTDVHDLAFVFGAKLKFNQRSINTAWNKDNRVLYNNRDSTQRGRAPMEEY
ncbi:hypothetical protein BGX28_005591 [Mortierella sp. GBA30]|nr:hypothetical protein BGX28_005591 [Mortierella sp. GBA30]